MAPEVPALPGQQAQQQATFLQLAAQATGIQTFRILAFQLRAFTATRLVTQAIDAPTVVAGEYVRSLASALGVDREIQFIGDDSWSDVPAAFDVRKRGVLSAMRSLQNLRHRLDALPSSMDFVFDHSGWRERFIGGKLLSSIWGPL